MDSKKAQNLMKKYASALAYIEVEQVDGTKGIGSCFHVGNGVFVTARHVVEGNIITQVKMTEPVGISIQEYLSNISNNISDEMIAEHDKIMRKILGTTPQYKHYQDLLELKAGPFFHPNPTVDVAVFQVSSVHPETSIISLGSHLDDWIYRYNLQLSEAIVLGYPPIPQTSEPHLVGARAEVNAAVSLYSSRNVHFIISAIPRGGFSGGLVISEYGFALGLVTQSLVKNNRHEESGFFAVLSIEPIYECLSYHKLLPSTQKDGWDDFWNTYSADYVRKKQDKISSSQLIVSLQFIDDGEKIGIGLCSYDKSIYCKMDALIRDTLTDNFLDVKVHETFNKYMYDYITEKVKVEIYDLLTRLMNLCTDYGLVTVRDQLTTVISGKMHY